MSREQSRRECEALVGAVDLPEPFELAEFCVRLGHRRGKPVVLMATPMAMGLCGLWMGTARADYVFYEQDTSLLHQQHIVFHEAGHMLRRHTPTRVLGADVSRALAADLDVGEAPSVLGRDTYSDDDEYEAEYIATLLLRRIGRTPPGEPQSGDESDAVARVERTLRRPEGR